MHLYEQPASQRTPYSYHLPQEMTTSTLIIKNYVCDQRLNLPTYTESLYLIQLFGNLLYILCCLECVSDVSFLSFQSTLIKVAEPCIPLRLGGSC